MKVLHTELTGKTVMSDEGLMLGRLRNITYNDANGELGQMLIEPSEDVDPRLFKRDNRGYLAFPFTGVRSVRDVIVINTDL